MSKSENSTNNQMVTPGERGNVGPVVSAEHLATGAMPALSEIEFALNITNNAYQRWMVRAAAAGGFGGLAANDILVLHSVNHRDREKSLADLCLVLNIEDTHLVNYSIKKLAGLGLVKTGKRGKEKTAVITEKGQGACERYREIREALLVESVKSLGLDEREVSRIAAVLRALSGQYEQAARSAASL
ncbi:MAG: winged helix DNA-binding protein [Rhizobiaceae bacterium]|nr:winged helix DNA-binding protein [Rhizobiaceae bacterium]